MAEPTGLTCHVLPTDAVGIAAYALAVEPMLTADPVRNTLFITALDGIRTGRFAECTDLAYVSAGEAVVACALRTPPFYLAVTAATIAAAQALAAGLAAAGAELPGVIALEPTARAFADTWVRVRSGGARVSRGERLFELPALVAPRLTPGAHRLAADGDVDLLTEWSAAFQREIGGRETDGPRRDVVLRISEGRAAVWDVDGRVVSYVGRNRALAGHARIGPVYTPPDERGRGYASCLTAAVSAELLAAGVRPVLFTDAANPTSNAIYQAIGYRLVGEANEIEFVLD